MATPIEAGTARQCRRKRVALPVMIMTRRLVGAELAPMVCTTSAAGVMTGR